MSAHDHTTRVDGCFRCQLSRDEDVVAEVVEIVDEQARRLSEQVPAVRFVRLGHGWSLVKDDGRQT